ncbi:MAG: hypothetical protein ACLQJ0_04950 [Steroidobacteraceae bacterium]|jgi:hypothetical protein
MKRVTIGEWTIEGDTDKSIVRQYILGTLKSMAGYDGVILPYEFIEKLQALIDSIPEVEFEGCLDEAQPDV